MSLIKWPGLIDVHVHLREPGATHKENFLSGGRAAIRGGFTCVLDMPNNPTPTITLSRLKQKIKLADQKAIAEIGFHFGTSGKNINEFKKVWSNKKVFGLKLYCNHTTGEMLVDDIHLLTEIFKAWKSKKPILVHAEGVQLAAVISLANLYNRQLHICHISQAVEVELVKQAKKKGQQITAGACPHHLFMTNKDVKRLKGMAMMKPPLGTKPDQQSLWQGLLEGTIDLVESDHAPHLKKEKQGKKIAFGVPGLETTLGLMLLAVKQKKCSLIQVKKWLHYNPKKIFNIQNQKDTHIYFDPNKPFVFNASHSATKCDWSPFDKWQLFGQIEKVIINGKKVYDVPFYDPMRSYEENFKLGPFGAFSNNEKCRIKVKSGKKFLGNELDLGFGIPAGPLLNSNFCEAAFEKGFDVCVYKTVRTRQYPCHAWPNIIGVKIKGNLTLKKAQKKLIGTTEYIEPLSITNSFGVPSPTVDWWQADMKKAVKAAKKGQVLIGSFQGTADGKGFKTQLKDYVLGAKLVKETGTKILEANLSCPNEGTADLLCFDVKRVTMIAEAIKDEIGETPLILKLAYFESNKHLKKLLKAVGSTVQGLAVINTIPTDVINEKGKQALPGKGRARSGICGKAIGWAGLKMTQRLKQLREQMGLKFEIIGGGGVTLPEDYHQYIKARADVVMSATGTMWDPHLGCKIKKELNGKKNS